MHEACFEQATLSHWGKRLLLALLSGSVCGGEVDVLKRAWASAYSVFMVRVSWCSPLLRSFEALLVLLQGNTILAKSKAQLFPVFWILWHVFFLKPVQL